MFPQLTAQQQARVAAEIEAFVAQAPRKRTESEISLLETATRTA
jgi:hypothetical protein